MLTQLNFRVINQSLTRTDTFIPVAGSKNYLLASFEFTTDDWDSINAKTAVFVNEQNIKHEVAISDGICFVPFEVLTNSGYIYVSVFAENTDAQFKVAVEKLEKENVDSLIIDLRQNRGGHLKTVTNMISLFTKKGDIIYQLKTKNKIEEFKDEIDEHREYKIVVIIDEESASASEVFTAAMKETYGAIVIGQTSFGKGKVQRAYNLSNGAMIKYTFQEWLTPNGNSIDGEGIKPDIEVEYKYNEKDNYDSQVKKAIEEMSK